MASALFAVVTFGWAASLDPELVNSWTFIGAVCFFAAAYLTLPEVEGRKQVIAASEP